MVKTPPRRERPSPDGVVAVLMPFTHEGAPDFQSWSRLMDEVWDASLTPAINMDTGHVAILSQESRRQVLKEAALLANNRRFVAGVFVEGESGDPIENQQLRAAEITEAGGLPIIFPCSAMRRTDGPGLARWFAAIGRVVPQFLGFELSPVFASFGSLWPLETYQRLLNIPQLIGSKHSSLDRGMEWARLNVRDAERPGFRLYSGNDLAIDMVEWGSDYLLGLAAFHVEAFAARDKLLAAGDARWRTLNDWLQYLGMFAFRQPVPAYKHSCAQYLNLRGLLPHNLPAPGAPAREASDIDILAIIRDSLDAFVQDAEAYSST
jgi:dihydrodipicolinate synthase/N-acetylneuraminate lyase